MAWSICKTQNSVLILSFAPECLMPPPMHWGGYTADAIPILQPVLHLPNFLSLGVGNILSKGLDDLMVT